MKTLSINLKAIDNLIELIVIGDTHIGSTNFNDSLLDSTIQYVLEQPNRYVILNGDILDCNFKDSVGNIYENALSPSVALGLAVKIFEPIKDRIICSIGGNHDHDRSMKQVDISYAQQLATLLGIADKFSADSIILFLSVEGGIKGHTNKNVQYVVFCSHGNNGGGGTMGSKANALEKMSLCVPRADLFIHSHTHAPVIFKDTYFDIDEKKKTLAQKERLYVNTNAYLRWQNSYGEKKLLKPQSMSIPIVKMKSYREHARKVDKIRKSITCELW